MERNDGGNSVLILQQEKEYILEELLEGVTPKPLEGELDWGKLVGEAIG